MAKLSVKNTTLLGPWRYKPSALLPKVCFAKQEITVWMADVEDRLLQATLRQSSLPSDSVGALCAFLPIYVVFLKWVANGKPRAVLLLADTSELACDMFDALLFGNMPNHNWEAFVQDDHRPVAARGRLLGLKATANEHVDVLYIADELDED